MNEDKDIILEEKEEKTAAATGDASVSSVTISSTSLDTDVSTIKIAHDADLSKHLGGFITPIGSGKLDTIRDYTPVTDASIGTTITIAPGTIIKCDGKGSVVADKAPEDLEPKRPDTLEKYILDELYKVKAELATVKTKLKVEEHKKNTYLNLLKELGFVIQAFSEVRHREKTDETENKFLETYDVSFDIDLDFEIYRPGKYAAKKGAMEILQKYISFIPENLLDAVDPTLDGEEKAAAEEKLINEWKQERKEKQIAARKEIVKITNTPVIKEEHDGWD